MENRESEAGMSKDLEKVGARYMTLINELAAAAEAQRLCEERERDAICAHEAAFDRSAQARAAVREFQAEMVADFLGESLPVPSA